MKQRATGSRPRTLRGNIRPTKATMHLEMTMLLHQEQRLSAELTQLQRRSAEIQTMMQASRQRIKILRDCCDGLDAATLLPDSAGRSGAAPSQERENMPSDPQDEPSNARR